MAILPFGRDLHGIHEPLIRISLGIDLSRQSGGRFTNLSISIARKLLRTNAGFVNSGRLKHLP